MPLSSTTTGPRLVVATFTLAEPDAAAVVAVAPPELDAVVVVVDELAVDVSAFFELLQARATSAMPATRATTATRWRERPARGWWTGDELVVTVVTLDLLQAPEVRRVGRA